MAIHNVKSAKADKVNNGVAVENDVVIPADDHIGGVESGVKDTGSTTGDTHECKACKAEREVREAFSKIKDKSFRKMLDDALEAVADDENKDHFRTLLTDKQYEEMYGETKSGVPIKKSGWFKKTLKVGGTILGVGAVAVGAYALGKAFSGDTTIVVASD